MKHDRLFHYMLMIYIKLLKIHQQRICNTKIVLTVYIDKHYVAVNIIDNTHAL